MAGENPFSNLTDADLERIANGSINAPNETAAAAPENAVDYESGAGFLERLQAGFKSSPESAANFYKAKGYETRVRNGEVQIRNAAKTGQPGWVQADPRRLELGDVADLIGDLPSMVGAGLGGFAGGTAGFVAGSPVPIVGNIAGGTAGALAGSAAGAAGGNVIKQAVGAMLPGQDVETPLQRVGNVALEAAFGAAGEGAGRLVQAGVLKPAVSRWLRTAAEEGAGTGVKGEVEALTRAINRGAEEGAATFQLPPGKATGGAQLQKIEAFLESSLAGAEQFHARAQQNVAALADKAFRMVDDLSAGTTRAGRNDVGQSLQTIVRDANEGMADLLEARAARDFGAVTRAAAGAEVQPLALHAAMAKLAAEDTNSAGVRGAVADGIDKLFQEMPVNFTVDDLQLYLKRFGRAGYGKGDTEFLARLGDTDKAKTARFLFSALQDDLERAAGSNPALAGLRAARQNFAAGVKEITDWQNSLFVKTVGEVGPESAGKIVDKLRNLDGAQLKSIMGVVELRPEVAAAVRANWIDNAAQAATQQAMRRTGAGPMFDAKKFVDMLGTTEQVAAVMGRGHRQVVNDVIALQRAVGYMGDVGGTGSFAAAGRIGEIIRMLPNPTQWGTLAKNLLVPGKLSRLLLDPKAMAEAHVVANAKAPTRRVVAAIAYLLGSQANQELQ